MKRLFTVMAVAWFAAVMLVQAQSFSEDFADSTLRLDYVLAGDKMGPEKRKKAESLGIPIITEAEFEAMIGVKREAETTGLLF